MNRALRIAIGIIAPPLIGSLLFVLYKLPDLLSFTAGQRITVQIARALDEIAMVVIVAFVLVGLQSIVCSLLVEFLLQPLKLRRSSFVLTCVVLGALAGIVPSVYIGWHIELLILGPLIGLIVGQMIYSPEQ